MSYDTIKIAQQLIQKSSVTPDDAGCQKYIIDLLKPLGFNCVALQYDEVTNLWATKGQQRPTMVFAGHTDVVPTGPIEEWSTPPFSGLIKNGILHGRGAADMKGSIAAMISATSRFLDHSPEHTGSIAFLITSDEEGPAVNGTSRVLEYLKKEEINFDYCIVGEPTAETKTGDMIKVGRRGSLNVNFRIKGKQGHVAYPHLAHNPIPDAANLIAQLTNITWDSGNAFFPPTTFQLSNLNSGTGANNVIPGHVDIVGNFRFSPESSLESLKQKVIECCQNSCHEYSLDWALSGMPFQTPDREFLSLAKKAVKTATGIDPVCSTTGGTSDGRFIAATGAEVVEIGPCNKTIHKINESVSTKDLRDLDEVYYQILVQLFGSSIAP